MWARSFLLLPLLLTIVRSSKLNVPRVLLPYAHTPPSFPLLSESGCYSWSSTRPEVVQVKPDAVGCSTSAVIQALGSSGVRGSAMVMAEDKDTGLLLRADVIVDKIHSLKIVTKTHELYLEETPEKFEVRAYDEHGNEFSTLKGLKFRWTIESGGNAKGTDILRFMTWKDSPYNTEPILEKLESQGSQGNKVLLEGIKTGSAKVSVKLVDPQHSSVPAAVEPLMVVANLFLLPPAANIIPCASLDYTANQFRGNRMIPVKLPSPNHNLVVPAQLGALDTSLARVIGGGEPGNGVVELVDQNVAPGEVVKTPTADLNVVIPASLELSCLPHNSWTVLANREVVLKVGILDKEGHKVHLSDNLVIELVVDGKFLKVTSSLANGTLHTGVPLVPGQTKVSATLVGAGTCTLATPVTTSTTMEILADMSLVPQLSVLPWDPVTHSQYTVKHVLTGGDSPLTWSSSNTSISTTSQLGISSVSGSLLGSSTVTVAMTRASHCQATAEIQVLAAAKLILLESEQEFEVGTTLALPLDLQFSAGSSFTSCASLPFTSFHSDSAFTSSIIPSGQASCAAVEVASSLVSHSKVSVSWAYPTEIGEKVTLEESVVVASYSPLVPTSPVTGETVLAIDSDRLVAWTGGPQAWPLKPANYFKDLQIGDQTLVTVTPVSHNSLHVYKVTCLAIGDTKITLTVGNKPSSTLARPVKVSSTMTIICSKPHTISLLPSIPGPTDTTLPPCPIQARQGRQAAQAYLDLKVLVTIKDAAERVIDSVSSVPVTWTISSPSLGSVSAPGSVITNPVTKEDVLEPGSPYQVLLVTGQTGEVDITATIARDGGLLGAGSHSDTAKIELVEDAAIEPTALELFELETGGGVSKYGSGFFTLKQDKEGLEATYTPSTKGLAVTPVGTGSTTVNLVDLCLSTKQPATMAVVVSGVASLVLKVNDKVEEGSIITATTTLLDSTKRPLPPSSFEHISLQITQDSDFVTIGSQGSGSGGGQAQFPVTGAKLGQVTLTAQASYGGKQVTSLPVQVTVYPPLLLDPRNISLIIGAAFQFTHTGGPVDCTVEFSIGDQFIATTNMDGIVTSATLGTTTLTGRAVGKDGAIYSEDTVQVFVRPLSSLQIMVPTKKVLVGSMVPLYLYGQDNDMNVYSYGSAMPLLNIDWSVTSPGYKPGLESPLQPAGLGLVAENNGVVVFRGATLGKSTITATVSITNKIEGNGQFQVDRDKTVSISTTITVVDRLEILNVEPKATSGGLLLAPGTSYQLQGNKAAVYSVATNSVVSTTKMGLVSAGTKTGSAVIIAKYTEGDRMEEVAVVVEVRPVQYLLARGAGDQWTGMELENLPKGGNLGLEITQHDSWGRKFDNGVKEVGNRPSRFDLVKLSTGTQGMKTVGKGWTVVRIWDKVSGKEAWLVTRVGEGIKGVTSMNIGDVADFDSTVSSLGEGKWVSEPLGVLDLDSVTGVVVAKRTGHARIKFMAGEESVFVRQVLVGKSEGMALDRELVLSSGEGEKMVGVVLGSGDSNLLAEKQVGTVPPPVDLFSCDIAWDLGMEISEVFSVQEVWAEDRWACVFNTVGLGPGEPAEVRLTVFGVVNSVKYLPAITVHHTRLEVGVAGGVIRVAGHSAVLDLLDTRHSEGIVLGSPWLEEGELHLPVTLSAAHYHSHPTVTVSVPQTGQAVTITILPMISSCKAPTGFMSAIVGDLLVYYQSVLSIIVAIVLAVYITKTFLTKPPKPTPAPAPAPAQSPVKQAEQTQEAGSPYLWTVDNSPIYGSPIFRRSPPTQPRNMAQYSYN
eukprot:TRINITY_DN4645_c0_g1_i5.p1 TRINITY_DN4645_c0_g1~~TRINITY_DN4645_c0_g1_i5.p1  ORF type:complete len:1790 (-),score=673.65 TRINITY_DN4645_c0_g1_i5:326-5671(-)